MANIKPDATGSPVKCFCSHKCGPSEHEFSDAVRRVFCGHEVELLVDPFGAGMDVGCRIETLEFHALLFLSSKKSNNSPYCLAELEVAVSRLTPIFVIRLKDEVPKRFRGRVYLDRATIGEALWQTKLDELAQAVRLRGAMFRNIGQIGPENPPEAARAAARRIADATDMTALAEFLDLLEKVFSQDMDPVARYHVAIAVGETRAPRAGRILGAWRDAETHPLVMEGIQEALEMLGCRV